MKKVLFISLGIALVLTVVSVAVTEEEETASSLIFIIEGAELSGVDKQNTVDWITSGHNIYPKLIKLVRIQVDYLVRVKIVDHDGKEYSVRQIWSSSVPVANATLSAVVDTLVKRNEELSQIVTGSGGMH